MKIFIAICFYILLLTSCTTREVAPTRESRQTIDTIYQRKVLGMQTELDSFCQAVMDSVYIAAVDSMLKERQEEINQLVK